MGAFITNAAVAGFEAIEQRLKILCQGSNPELLHSKLTQMQEGALEIGGGIDGTVDSSIPQTVEALQRPWDLLMQFKRGDQKPQHDRLSPTIQRPSQVILREGTNSADLDRECLTVMLQDIKHHVQPHCRPPCIVRTGTPVYAEIGYFFTHDETDTNGLRCCYGLQMLLETYKSYLLVSHRKCAPPSCRLQALKFAQEAIPHIQAVLGDSSMPCRCCHTLAFYLENLNHEFKAFLQQNVFDLYFQSPWVCGSHILEMLESLFYYGLRLFSYRHFVGSVVHVYNILRECTNFQSIPLLETLCDKFSEILFPGGRPTRSFKACCFRYMGGRLRFDSHASDHKSGAHKMWIPARTARATAGFGLQREANDARFQYRKVSILYHIKEKGYHLDHCSWNRVYDISKTHGRSTPEKDTKIGIGQRRACSKYTDGEHENDRPQTRLHHLQTTILTELTGPFPMAKINFFQIYLSCVRIVSIISDKTHGDSQHDRNCLCFLDAIISAADRYRENEYRMQPFGCKEVVGHCKDAIVEVLGGKPLDDFLWKGI